MARLRGARQQYNITLLFLVLLRAVSRAASAGNLPRNSAANHECGFHVGYWAEARIKIARMTLTIKLDGNWSSFQLANSTPPLCVTDSAIVPSAQMLVNI